MMRDRPRRMLARPTGWRLLLVALLLAAVPLSGSAVAHSTSDASKLAFTTPPALATGGSPFGTQPQVTIEDSSGNTVDDGSTVTLAIMPGTGGGGTLSGCSGTDSAGVITFSGCQIDTAGAGYKLTASDTGLTPATSTAFDVGVGDPTQVAFTQAPSDIQAGTNFSPAPQLSLEDAGGNVVDTSAYSFGLGVFVGPGELSCDTATGGETAAPSTGTPGYKLAGSNGVATFGSCTIGQASAASYELVGVASNGTAAGDHTFVVDSGDFTVSAGGPTQLVFTTSPTGAKAGTPFGTQPKVAIEDSVGDVVKTASGTITLSITSGTGASGANLTCPAQSTSDGVATFSGCGIDLTSSSNYTLSASLSSSALTGTSAPFIVSAGGAATLAFTNSLSDSTGGAPLSPQPTVTVSDSGGNPVSGTVQLALEGGTAGAKLSCAVNPAPAGTGQVTFSKCSVDLAGNGYQLVASDPSDPSVPTVTSGSFDVGVGPAAQVVFGTSPAGASGGLAFGTPPVVSVEDLGGNPIPGSSITLGIASGTGAAGATLTCTPSNTAVASSGTKTFSGCAIDKAAPGYQLTATSGGKVGTSTPFTVAAGSEAALKFSVEPSGGIVSSPFGAQPQVSVTDAGGNPVAAGGAAVTLSISGGSLTCLANTVTSNAAGLSAFAGCQASGTGTFTLQASAPGLTPATSTPFTIAAGGPLEVAPVATPLGQTFGGAILGKNPTSVTDDVDSATGALQLSLTDLQAAALGEPFNLNRSYNSLDTAGGSFGPGWSSILDAGVTVAANGLTALVRNTDGQQLVFTSNGHGGWNAPPGARATLACQGALCTVTRFDGVVFQSIGGQIQDYLGADGIGLHFIYSGGRLVEVTGSAQELARGVQASLGAEVGTLGWTTETANPAVTLTAVDAVDNQHVWAVGGSCTIELTANGGTTWAKDTNVTCPSSGTTLSGIYVQGGAGPGWAVGNNGTVLVCSTACNTTAASWAPLVASTGGLPPSDESFTSVWAADPNHVYATGTEGGVSQIWACSAKCNATGAASPPGPPPAPPGPPTWKNVTPSGLGSALLSDIGGAGPGEVIAVGSNGTILICSTAPTCATSGAAWTPLSGANLPAANVTFTGVWASDPNHVYAVGSAAAVGSVAAHGVIWACSANCNQTVNGPAPAPGPPPPPPPPAKSAWADITPAGVGTTSFSSVTGQGPDHAWAVGDHGQIWYCPSSCTTSPTSWVSLSPPGPTSGALLGVTSSDPKHAWAVGANGTIVATTGTPSPTLDALDHAIAALGVALNPALWADGNHLAGGQPNQALDQTLQAIQQLASVTNPPAPPGPPPAVPNYPAWVVTQLVGLDQALRILDANAISENLLGPVHANQLATAETQYAAGDTQLAASQFPQAGQSYHDAWAQAKGAQGTGQGSHKPLVAFVTENANGEVMNVTTPTREVSYGYTGTLLTSFTDADNKTWTYAYNADGKLTGVTDPLMQPRLTVSYAGGRVAGATATGSQRHFVDTYSWDAATQTSMRSTLVQLGPTEAPTWGTYLDQYKGSDLVSQQLPDGATTDYSYDNQLNLVEVQDPLGRITTTSYNAAGDLTGEVTPYKAGANAVTGFTYNAAHEITSTTDGNGNTTSDFYTGGNLTQITPPGPAAGATHYLYNYLGEQYEADTPTGIGTFTYDDAGNLAGFQKLDLHRNSLDGLGPVFSYNEEGLKLVSTDPRGHTAGGLDPAYQSVNTYDPDGNLLTTTSPGPQTTTNTYTDAGDPLSTTNPAGQKTTFSWDEAALTFTATGPTGATTSTFDPSGNLLAKTDPGGRTTSYTYDTTGRELSVTDPTNITTFYTPDLEGNVVASTDSAGHSSSFTYDPQNRPLTSTIDGVTTSTAYDAAGNVITKTDAAGRVTSLLYNSHELPASVTNHAGTTSYTYDLSDNLVVLTDGNGHKIGFTVDGAGQRTQMTVNGLVTNYGYDVAGNLVSTLDPDGRLTHYTLNPEDLRTEIDYSQPGHASISVTQAFNAAGQRTQMTDPTTGINQYTYDASGDLTEASNAAGSFGYDYSAPGQMTETYPDGSKITYVYDDGHNVMSVSTDGATVEYVRNAARQVTAIAYSNGVLQTKSYNQAGQVTADALLCGGTTELTSFSSFGPAGDPIATVTTAGTNATTTSFGYDGSGRFAAQSAVTATAATGTATSPAPGCTSGTPATPSAPAGNDGSGSTTDSTTPTSADQPTGPTGSAPTTPATDNPITYDAVGNITAVGGTSINYNAGDEVTAESGSNPVTYTYDSTGNVTSKTVGGVLTTYAYNAADELVAVTKGATTITYTYDGDGNRVSKTVTSASPATVVDYSWDPSTTIPLLALERDGGGNLIARFIYGVGPVAMQTPAGTTYLHTDQQGDITALTDPTGAVLETFTYDAFGNVTANASTGATVPAEPLLFQGQLLDSDTGLYDMRARNYDPTTGRFTQRDPLPAAIGVPAMSPYVFADDQPTVSGDPTGLADVSSIEKAAFEGHSDETDDIVQDAKYGTVAVKVGIKAVSKIADFFSTTAESAESGLAKAGDAIAEAGPELADSAEFATKVAGPELSEAGAGGEEAEIGLGDTAGKLLGVAGIGLGVYLTVEDCEHGTVSQCVGDSIGVAVGAVCLVATEGIGAVACGIAAAALGIVIAEYGPEIAQGFVDLGGYIAEGGTVAINAISDGFHTAGVVLKGQFAALADETVAGLEKAAQGISNAYDAAAGAISTGFNTAVSAISSGYDKAVAGLEQAGLSALQLADTLKNVFNEGLADCVNQLIDLKYDIDNIGNAIANGFNQTAAQAAAFFKGLGYSVDQIAGSLASYAFNEAAAGWASILKGLDYGIDQITGAIESVYAEGAAFAAGILKDINYGINEISSALRNEFTTLGDEANAAILQGLNYTYDQIAGALTTAYNDGAEQIGAAIQFLGAGATEIADTLRATFSSLSPADVAGILQTNLGYAVDDVATALEHAYSQTAMQIATVLKGIGDDITQISNMLSTLFNETTSQIESGLSSIGFDNSTIQSIGGAFKSFGDDLSSVGDTIASWF